MDISDHKLILPVFIAAAASAAAVIARGIAFSLLRKWDRRAETRIGDVITDSIRVPSIYWCTALGLPAGIAPSDLPEKYTFYFNTAPYMRVIFSVTIAIANFAEKIFKNYI